MVPTKRRALNQDVNEIFAPLWLDESWRYAVLMGGRGTGRSTAGTQYDISHIMAPGYFRNAIMRSIHGDIRSSIYQDLVDHIDEHDLNGVIKVKTNDMSFQYGKNSIHAHGFKASSNDQSSKLKSLANYTNVRIEEAKDVGKNEFMKLDDSLRTVKARLGVIFQTNPPAKSHWLIERFFDLEEHPDWPGFHIPHPKTDTDDDFIYIGGTYLDNLANLDPATIKRYRGYERTQPEYYAQEILGLVPDQVRGKVYHGWQLVNHIPRQARFIGFGTDFGWYPDPCAVVAIWYCNGIYYVDEVIYGTELENEVVTTEIREYIEVNGIKNAINIADAAEPKSIAAYNKAGVKTLDSLKGADAEGYRINVTSKKKICVTKTSLNVWESYLNYAHEEDKNGKPTGRRVHAWSHAMDAIGQYFAWEEGGTSKGSKVSVNKPVFKRYGHVTELPVPGHNGNGVRVNRPTRK